MKEKILDLGSGRIGSYTVGTGSAIDYCCIDTNREDLRLIKKRYNNIHVIQALAENLPLKEKKIDQIFIYFPTGSLLAPGIQSYRTYPPEFKHEPIKVEGNSLYEKFSKVIKPEGKLIITGDWMLLADKIISEKKYEPYFALKEKRELPDYELITLNTPASNQILNRRSINLEAPATQLIFKKI